jgi:hypothetical protein
VGWPRCPFAEQAVGVFPVWRKGSQLAYKYALMSRAALLGIPLLLIGCNLSDGSSVRGEETGETTGCVKPDRGVNNGTLPEGCSKIEGDDICNATSITAGGSTVTITGWIHKDGEEGECIGFTYTSSGAATITVKASTEVLLEDGDGTFLFEDHGISNIVVCEGDQVPPPPPPPDDGDGCDPDNDGDGVPDDVDDDDDNDGVPDVDDPDADGDGVIDDPGDGSACTAHEDCESGVCLDGVCVVV